MDHIKFKIERLTYGKEMTFSQFKAVKYLFKVRRDIFKKFNDSYYKLDREDMCYSVKLTFIAPWRINNEHN